MNICGCQVSACFHRFHDAQFIYRQSPSILKHILFGELFLIFQQSRHIASAYTMEKNSSFNDTTSIVISDGWQRLFYALTFIKVVIFICALLGNVLTMIAYYRFSNLRTSSNKMILSLAVVDLISGIVAIMAGMTVFISQNTRANCQLAGKTMLNGLIYGSILTAFIHIFIVTFDRFLAITQPLHYSRWMTPKLENLLIISTWTIGYILGFCDNLQYIGDNVDHCTHSILYGSLVTGMVYLLVTGPVSVMYYRIWSIIRSQKSQIQAMTISAQVSVENSTTENVNRQNERKSNISKRERKSIAMIFAVVLAFIILWLPLVIHGFLHSTSMYTDKLNGVIINIIYDLCLTIGFVNAAINVVIYAIMNTEFRRAYQTILSCRQVEHC